MAMRTMGLPGDLAWWRENRATAEAPALRALLARLQAWKTQHDEDRARQAGPFLQMVWDGIYGDDDADVTEAIAELEAALEGR